MISHAQWITILGLIVIAAPVVMCVVLGGATLINRKLSEEATGRLAQVTIVIGLMAALVVLTLMLVNGTRHESIELGEWVVLPHHDHSEPSEYHFAVKLVFDRLSVPLAILSFVLCGTISAFTTRYLHREPGYNRFFVLYALFVLGMILTSLAGTIETLFAGWELVGVSSALLVAFFQERHAPVRNGLRVWIVYRVSDAALLLAAIVMHHLRGEGDFDKLLGFGGDPASGWPMDHAAVSGWPAFIVGLLLHHRRGGQVGPGAVLRLAAAGDGRSDPVQRRVLRGPLGSPGRVPAAARQPAPGNVARAASHRRGFGIDHRPVCLSRRQRADRHQVGPVLRLAGAGRPDRGRNRASGCATSP